MANRLQKRWVFTMNADEAGRLPPPEELISILSMISKEAIFQLEKGSEASKLHYQGRFTFRGDRIGKRALLELFDNMCLETKNFTLRPEISYNESERYCSKGDTRVDGPWIVGFSKKQQAKRDIFNMTLRKWQEELRQFMITNQEWLEDRKVIYVEDLVGGHGKSKLMLNMKMVDKPSFERLPFDKPDRIRHAVCKICNKKDVDIFGFDFTRTQSNETSLNDLFQVVEEIKNQHIVSVMYGNFTEVIIAAPIIIIFSNYKFDEISNYLSADRWVHLKLEKGEIFHIPPNGFGGHPAGWGVEDPTPLAEYQPCIDYEAHKHGEQGACDPIPESLG